MRAEVAVGVHKKGNLPVLVVGEAELGFLEYRAHAPIVSRELYIYILDGHPGPGPGACAFFCPSALLDSWLSWGCAWNPGSNPSNPIYLFFARATSD
jgi:hypothetical protein